MLTAVATKSLKIAIFNHLMLVDANCDDSVTIPRCPNLVVDLKGSVALEKKLACLPEHLGTPLFQILDPPLVCTMQSTLAEASTLWIPRISYGNSPLNTEYRNGPYYMENDPIHLIDRALQATFFPNSPYRLYLTLITYHALLQKTIAAFSHLASSTCN